MSENDETLDIKNDPVIREIIELERRYYFEKRTVKTRRQRELKELIERHVKSESSS